ncbi:MAG TPA: DUF948 domain-containing protein [Thermodesulfatator atlanticus]|uniref:DUF948 domain-containing protein n=1 Tax=Thermodesulfatator atlanticus TaxID=501497 RepID=A0A7V5U3N9_9BACT|nr:DUF948 domain-containing protein [Thermodesulfatator atlanticus]
MDLQQGLYVAGIAAGISFVVLVIYLLGLVGKLKNTLNEVDQSLTQARTILNDLDVELKPVISSTQKTLEQVNSLGGRVENLVEEISVLPPAAKELLETFQEIARDLSDEIKQTLDRVNTLLEESSGRIQKDVPAVLAEVEQLLKQLNGMVEDIKEKLAKTQQIFEAVEETGRATKVVAEIISKNIAQAAIEVAAVAKGLEVALKTFKKRLPIGGEA